MLLYYEHFHLQTHTHIHKKKRNEDALKCRKPLLDIELLSMHECMFRKTTLQCFAQLTQDIVGPEYILFAYA